VTETLMFVRSRIFTHDNRLSPPALTGEYSTKKIELMSAEFNKKPPTHDSDYAWFRKAI